MSKRKLIVADALRNMHDGTSVVDFGEHANVLYVHIAPAEEIRVVHEMNVFMARLIVALVRLGVRPDRLSFRNCDGAIYLGRITYSSAVVSVYPARWLAEQMSGHCRYPLPVLAISEHELVP